MNSPCLDPTLCEARHPRVLPACLQVEGEAAHTPLNNWLQRKMRLSLRSDYPSSLL